jgi:putative endopeptidase
MLAEIDASRRKELAAVDGQGPGRDRDADPAVGDGRFQEPDHESALTWQGGLGLPDRDYYLKGRRTPGQGPRGLRDLPDDAGHAGRHERSAGSAKRVMAIEQSIAEAHGTRSTTATRSRSTTR